MTALDQFRVIPVVSIDDLEKAVPLTAALAEGGLPVIEVTMRTEHALAAVTRIRGELPHVLCGVGTVLTTSDVKAALDAGAQFLVSPGTTDSLLTALIDCGVPALPGCVTASEAMRLLEAGFTRAKFFPAETSGGARAIAALGGPLPGLRFCATGGITPTNAADYLALANVTSVGGSWMVPSAAVSARDWDRVLELARDASAL